MADVDAGAVGMPGGIATGGGARADAEVDTVPFGDGKPVPCWFVAMTRYV